MELSKISILFQQGRLTEVEASACLTFVRYETLKQFVMVLTGRLTTLEGSVQFTSSIIYATLKEFVMVSKGKTN